MESTHPVGARESGALTQRLTTPAAGRPRTWVRRIRGGGQRLEACPSWCTADHATDRVSRLTELRHSGDEVSSLVEVFDHWAVDGAPVTAPLEFLMARVKVEPYSEDPRRNVPHVAFEPVMDDVAEPMDPEQFAALIGMIRTHLGRLEQVHAQLVQALAEHPGTPAVA